MKKASFLFLLGCLIPTLIFSQQKVFGVIIDSKTKEPLPGASVYFENTSIGTTTNLNGEFELKYNSTITSPLLLSFIGYKTIRINTTQIDLSKKITVSLIPNGIKLNEIVVNSFDGWPYYLKLKEFKKHYLGTTFNGKSCKIINTKDLILRYDSIHQKLTVTSKKPIIIKNERLKYLITVNDLFFEAKYLHVSRDNKVRRIDFTYYHGSNFYKTTKNPSDNKTLQIRKNTYNGSILHLIRSISKKRMQREGFFIYRGTKSKYGKDYLKFPIFKEIKVYPFKKGLVTVYFPNYSVTLIHKETKNKSYIHNSALSFTIDSFGHYSSGNKIKFDGFLGSLRMGDQLPLDYQLEK